MSDIWHKDCHQQHHCQDHKSYNDVGRPGEGLISTQEQGHCFTCRELNKWHSQQHREQYGQSDCHHHDVMTKIHIVAEQQLRVHMGVEGEIAEQGRDEVKQEAEADADICYILHPLLRGSVQFAVDRQDGCVAQEGEGHGGDGVGTLA